MQKSNATKPLTGRQRIAAEHYATHGDKTKSYRAAYSCANQKPETSTRNAHRVFSLPHVAAYVEQCREAVTDKVIATRTEVLQILSEIARGKVSAFMDENGNIDRRKVAQSGYSLESYRIAVSDSGSSNEQFKVRDPIAAIDRIAKLEGWDKQRDDDSSNVTFTFIIQGEPAHK